MSSTAKHREIEDLLRSQAPQVLDLAVLGGTGHLAVFLMSQ